MEDLFLMPNTLGGPERSVFTQPFDYYDRKEEEMPPAGKEVCIFEAATDTDTLATFSGQQRRSLAMAAALSWLEAKEFTFGSLDAIVVGLADLDGDGEVSDEEEGEYNELLASTGNALVSLGGDPANVTVFIEGESADQGKKLGRYLAGKLDGVELEDNQLITRYAVTRSGGAIFEAATKVIRDGKVAFRKKRVKKYRMNAAQRAALKKARRKSNSAAARRNRAKSMRARKQRGMK